jgi:protein PsiE
VGLLVIAIATVVAASGEVMTMIKVGRVTLADLLMLFLYLEVLAMVGPFYGSGKLPMRFPLHIAIVALARGGFKWSSQHLEMKVVSDGCW